MSGVAASTLLFVNENGLAAEGTLVDSTHVVATGWGNLSGTIDADTGRILWANGSLWARVPTLDRNGNWHTDHHRPTAIGQLGADVLFTNEHGGRSTGKFHATAGLTAADWSLGGTVDMPTARILWSNQSVWSDSQFGAQDQVFADVNDWPWLA